MLGNAHHTFDLVAHGKGGVAHAALDTAGCYEAGIRVMMKMFKGGGKPVPHENMIEAIAVGEAVEKSLKSGQPATLPAKLL